MYMPLLAARVGATVPTVDPEEFFIWFCVLCCSFRRISLYVCCGSLVVCALRVVVSDLFALPWIYRAECAPCLPLLNRS
jgi:hypothetical protein